MTDSTNDNDHGQTPETLETLLQFPCDFPIKIVGNATDEFEIAVLTIVRKHVPDLDETAITLRMSKNGKYRSMTVKIYATSKNQLDNIYLELTASEHVLMAL